MNRRDQSNYETNYYPETGVYVRVDKTTGASWTWSKREKKKRTQAVASNGATIEKLVKAGNKVRIRHMRYATCTNMFNPRTGHTPDIVVPSTFRYDDKYYLRSKGGFTHITIQTRDGDYFCYSSQCDKRDTFCYSTGIAKALEKISDYMLEKLYGTGVSN